MSSFLTLPPERFLPLLALILIAGWLTAIVLRELYLRFGVGLVGRGARLWQAGWERPGAMLRGRAPRLTAFIERRFDPRRSDGLIVTLMVIAAIYIGVNLIVDILYGVLDPRIRVS